MPTSEQQQELQNSCTAELMYLNGVEGKLLTGPNGNTLFLPAAGGCDGTTPGDVGTAGYYWSRTLCSVEPDNADNLCFNSGYLGVFNFYRYYGFAVRPVRVAQ